MSIWPIQTEDALVKLQVELQSLEDSERQLEETRKHRERQDRQDEKVCGGIRTDWKPVNREAAMLLAKSPWYNQPPSNIGGRKMTAEKLDLAKARNGMFSGAIVNHDMPVAARDAGVPCIDMEKLADLVVQRIKDNLPPNITELARAAIDARKVLMESIEGINTTMMEFDRVMEDSQQDIRSKRMNLVSDSANAVKALKDIRQFFLGKDYESERQRLADFVELCERLQKLKESGFLDTVADTMIRLSA